MDRRISFPILLLFVLAGTIFIFSFDGYILAGFAFISFLITIFFAKKKTFFGFLAGTILWIIAIIGIYIFGQVVNNSETSGYLLFFLLMGLPIILIYLQILAKISNLFLEAK